MNLNEYVGMGIFIIAIIGIVWRISHILNRKVSYESLDRCKKEVMEAFVSKDVCAVMHGNLRDDVVEIKADVKQLLRKANGQ